MNLPEVYGQIAEQTGLKGPAVEEAVKLRLIASGGLVEIPPHVIKAADDNISKANGEYTSPMSPNKYTEALDKAISGLVERLAAEKHTASAQGDKGVYGVNGHPRINGGGSRVKIGGTEGIHAGSRG